MLNKNFLVILAALYCRCQQTLLNVDVLHIQCLHLVITIDIVQFKHILHLSMQVIHYKVPVYVLTRMIGAKFDFFSN